MARVSLRLMLRRKLLWGLFALGLLVFFFFYAQYLVVWITNQMATETVRFAGIPVGRVLVQTAVVSGGLAAHAGFSEVAGLTGNLSRDLSPGFGYTGIVVAMLALLHPLGVVLAALFVAGIFVGADSMSRVAEVPSYIADVILAGALLFMVTAVGLTRWRVRWR